MATTVEQLRFLDEQLAAAALPADQAELVQLHRLTGIQLRAARLADCGPEPPARTHEHAQWQQRRKEVEADVELRLAETRLSVEGLEESWEKWLHIEKLRVVREQLMQQTAAESLAEILEAAGRVDGGGISLDCSGATPISPVPGQHMDAAAWEALQIAPLASPGAWGLQQALQAHPAERGLEGGADLAQLHLHSQQWQDHAHTQEPQEDAAAAAAAAADAAQPAAEPAPAQQQAQEQAAQQQQPPEQEGQEGQEGEEDGVAKKMCRRCNTVKPLTQFYRSKANSDGYDGRCKACDAVQCAQRRKRKERVENPTVEWKVCRRCAANKPALEFYRNKTNPDGLYNNCKECFAADAAQRRERLPPLEARTAQAKACRRCRQTKPASEFYRNKHMSDGLYTHCKACYTAAANQRSAGRAPAETKRCRRCGQTKEADAFYSSKMTADGLQSYCKTCYAAASAQRRARASQESSGGRASQGASPGEQACYSQEQAFSQQQQEQAYSQQQQEQACYPQEPQQHLMQGGLAEHGQAMGMPLDPALQQLQQLGYDPASVMQASLDPAALAQHLEQHTAAVMERHGHSLAAHHAHALSLGPHHHLDPLPHLHLDPHVEFEHLDGGEGLQTHEQLQAYAHVM